jgi:hypothetical protein
MTSNGPGGGASSPPPTMASPTVNEQPADRSEGPFVLQPWIDSVPLSADGAEGDIKINCVEYFGSCALCLRFQPLIPFAN